MLYPEVKNIKERTSLVICLKQMMSSILKRESPGALSHHLINMRQGGDDDDTSSH
ncbi:Hypothetical predicted protein [Scomber scombrus]|uniref:Uncharacterized protein n=1 Tax=Scomber scombrus TaxID=13677 RepID=A0AAV1MXK6_SCOSC